MKNQEQQCPNNPNVLEGFKPTHSRHCSALGILDILKYQLGMGYCFQAVWKQVFLPVVLSYSLF